MGSAAVERGAVLKVAQNRKNRDFGRPYVRSFGCSAASEAAVLGYSTVGAWPGRLLVARSAGGERGALLKVGIFQVCKRVEWSAWATTTS